MAAAGKRRNNGDKKHEPLGRIQHLEIENFKSYEGRHEIGPFDKFTCVIGPNGSGKSNIMDAISFCLGIRAKHLRGDKLRDLVYRREEETVESNPRSAKVTIVFVTSEGKTLHFGRSINAKGEGVYRYGPPQKTRIVNYEDFVKHLADQHIYVKARNFLVFQGDVMELARRQGTDLTGMLETISESDQLKDEYNRMRRELELLQERARMHFQHRREAEGTVAELERQRAEVQRFQDLRAQKERLAVEMALFRLCVAEHETSHSKTEVASLRADLNSCEADGKVKRKEAEAAEGEGKKVGEEVDKVASDDFVLNSNLEQLRPEMANCRRQSAHYEKKLKETGQQIVDEELRRKGLQASLEKAREDRLKAESDAVKLRERQETMEPVLRMSEAQRAEFEQAAIKTDVMNMRTRERIKETEEQLDILMREITADRQDFRELEEKRTRGIEKVEAFERRQAELQQEIDGEMGNSVQQRQQAAAAAEEVQRYDGFLTELLAEKRRLRSQLDAEKGRQESLHQVAAQQRVAEELRGAFPDGVLGRVSELVLPTQKRFDLPLRMSMGNMAEAIIVRDAAVGRECMRYLKAKRIASETFLPVDSIVEPKVGPLHVLTQGHTARRLATACAQHNERFLERTPHWQKDGPSAIDKTLSFLLGGVIIADDLPEARSAAYTDARKAGLRPRVVTLLGEVVHPNGNISVQSVGSAGRVEFGGAERLHEIKQQEEKLLQIDKDISELREVIARRQQMQAELNDWVREREERLQVCGQRAHAAKAGKAMETQVLASQAKRLQELKSRLTSAADRQTELGKAKDRLEAALLQAGKKHFANLNRELGVDDVRELVRREQREKKQMREELEQLEDAVRTLLIEEQRCEQRMNNASKLEALNLEAQQCQRDIEAVKERRRQLEVREKALSERLEAKRAQVRELNLRKQGLEEVARAKRNETKQLKEQADRTKAQLKKSNEKVRILLTYQCGVFREAGERQVVIPLLEKTDLAMETMLLREQDLDDLPLENLQDAVAAVKVDFAALPEEKKQLAGETRLFDSKAVTAEYEAQIGEVEKELGAICPNMRAVDECATEEEKLKQIRQQAEEASLNSQRLERAFEKVKEERIARFQRCYSEVEAKIAPYYKELTSYDGHEGGSAYLDLDDAEEPYNGGVTFTACPPGKRFFPMDQLSGGERSMASMALLFAMHAYNPPPFMILDEVDAPFDRKNTRSLVSYLKTLDFQCLVISLKDTFFSHSDSIVGIYKDKDLQSSGSLSLPLGRLGGDSGRQGLDLD